MYYKGDQMVKKLTLGDKEIKAVYYQNHRIYPNITGQEQGADKEEWVYTLPDRTRKVTPWTRDIYADGSVGEKVYGTQTTEKETATVSTKLGDWSYNITTTSGTRTCTVVIEYKFTDTIKSSPQPDRTEAGNRSVGTWTYNATNNTRTATVTYTFPDGVKKTKPITESGTITSSLIIAFKTTGSIGASGGTIGIEPNASLQKKWNNVVYETVSRALQKIQLSGTTTGFSISGMNVIAANRGTTLGNARSVQVYGTITLDGKELKSNNLTITQSANSLYFTGFPMFEGSIFTEHGAAHSYTIRVRLQHLIEKYSSGEERIASPADLDFSCPIEYNSVTTNWCSVSMRSPDEIQCNLDSNYTGRQRYVILSPQYKSKKPNVYGSSEIIIITLIQNSI